MGAEPAGFREYVEARSPALLRTAWMLTGNAATAEDLLQSALARTWPHWHRISTGGSPDAYVRTVMVHLNASWRRRRWSRERPSADPADRATPEASDEHGRAEDRLDLLAALAALPVRQRQAVVLRYFDDLSVEDTAAVMGSSVGTVKSQTARGLAKLREAMGTSLVPQEER